MNKKLKDKFPLISVAVPAFNEEKYIGKCLESLRDQSLPKNQYEIIVVIREDTVDDTYRICKKYGVKIIFEKPGIGLARFRGFEEAKAGILAGTDADTIVPKDWLKIILEDFRDPKVVSVTGPVLPRAGTMMTQQFAFWFATKVYQLAGRLEGKAYMSGMNFAVRKDAYEKCGGFDPEIRSAEDTDLTDRISTFGIIKFDNRMKVYTSTRRLKEGYIRSFLRYSWNYILLKMGKKPPAFPHFR